MAQHALDVLQHVARAHAQQLALALGGLGLRPSGHSSSASIHSTAPRCAGLRRCLRAGAARCATPAARCQSLKAALRVEQLLLQVAELARQQAAQVEVAVDHVVHHAQHQVGRARAAGAPRAQVAGGLPWCVQPAGEVVAHGAVGRVHGDAARGRRSRSRPGWCRSCPAPAAPRRACRGSRRRRGRRCRRRREAAEHQQVVPRGVVEVRLGSWLFSRSETCRSTSGPAPSAARRPAAPAAAARTRAARCRSRGSRWPAGPRARLGQ